MNDDSVKQLIDSFLSYRDAVAPLQESLHAVAETYREIRSDLENLDKSFSSGTLRQLDRVHETLSSQAKVGQELSKKMEEYSAAGDKFARAVTDTAARFNEVSERISSLEETEKSVRAQISKIDALIAEKKATYNVRELQRSLDGYNANVEKISDFINRDIAEVLKNNAEKIEGIRKENEQLAKAVAEQGKDVEYLISTFKETCALLKKVAESGTVNEQYLFDAFDKWAADRKVKIKKK